MVEKDKPPYEPKNTEEALKLWEEILRKLLDKVFDKIPPVARLKLMSQGLSPAIIMPRGGYYSASTPLRIALDTNDSTISHKLQLWLKPSMAAPTPVWPTNLATDYFTVPTAQWDDNYWSDKPIPAGTMTVGKIYEVRLYCNTALGPLLVASKTITATT
jgi:hypothetical protein